MESGAVVGFMIPGSGLSMSFGGTFSGPILIRLLGPPPEDGAPDPKAEGVNPD
jgi:hypothetical protein